MPELDYLITGAEVFDGLAVEPRRCSVGILGDRIAFVGATPAGGAHRVIEAGGCFLCPGFIDTHASTGLGYRSPGAGHHKLFQGVTTEIIGNCGASQAPIGEKLVAETREQAGAAGVPFDWRDLGEWLESVEAYGLPLNVGTLVGHGTLRAGVCSDMSAVTAEETADMAALLERAMEEGALGLSTGLVYWPGSFAATGEIIDLAAVAARHGGIYASHMRNEREALLDSIEETIEIGSRAGLPVLISHLKAAERPNWGRMGAALERIERARAEGVRINFDVYPYTETSTRLRTFLPAEILKGGVARMVERLGRADWRRRCGDWLRARETDFAAMRLITESRPGAAGRSVEEVAGRAGEDPADCTVDLVRTDPETWIVYGCIAEDDMDAAILWPASMLCSDSWSYPVNAPRQIGEPHPRTFGAFTRFLERYALRRERLPFGEAVRKITSYPADWLGLSGRGRVAEGCFADLVLLDPARVHERATFDRPRQLSEGTEAVWVNGTLVLERGEPLPETPGRVLRGA